MSDVLTEALKEITLSLSKEENVVFPGFGTFSTRMRPASQGRSFQSGRTIKVPAMRLAAFRAGELLKKAVRRSK